MVCTLHTHILSKHCRSSEMVKQWPIIFCPQVIQTPQVAQCTIIRKQLDTTTSTGRRALTDHLHHK